MSKEEVVHISARTKVLDRFAAECLSFRYPTNDDYKTGSILLPEQLKLAQELADNRLKILASATGVKLDLKDRYGTAGKCLKQIMREIKNEPEPEAEL